jgi:hypothetical protein
LLAAVLGLLLVRDEPGIAFLAGRLCELAPVAGPAAAIVVAAVLCGLWFLPADAVGFLTAGEIVLFAGACGASLFSCVFLALGAAGAANMAVLWIVAIAAATAGTVRLWLVPTLRAHLRPRPLRLRLDPFGFPEIALFAALAAAGFLVAVASLAPPLLYDVTEYHLGAFRDYARMPGGWRIGPVLHNFYARFPFPVEALYFMGLLMEGSTDFAPKLINAAFVAGCAALLWQWLKRCGVATRWRLLAALMLLAHPVLLEVSLDAYIDAPAAFFTLAAVYAALLAAGAAGGGDENPAPALLPVAGWLAGTALVTKYTVPQLFLLPVLLCILPPVIGAARRGKVWRPLTAAALLACVPAAFWLGKNIAFYGNPLEPFFQRVFRPGDALAVSREQYYIESHYPQSPFSAQYWQTLATRLGGIGWLVLAPLAGFPAIARRRTTLRLLAFVAVSYLLWNLVRYSQDRFLLAATTLAILLGARVLDALPCGLPRAAVGAVLAIGALANLLPHAVRIAGGGEFSYACEFDSRAGTSVSGPRAEFYRGNLGALGEIVVAADRELPPSARLLLVYEARPYLFRREAIYNTVFDASELLRLAKGAKNGAEVGEKLRAAGITHVLVNREELRRFIDQYARPEQLQRLGIRSAMGEFDRIAVPEDLYPPFHRSPDWQAMRAPVLEFLSALRSRAVKAAGRAPAEVWLAPL